MAWVVDTCVLLDIAENDPTHGKKSAIAVDQRRQVEGCIACPISIVELAPQFKGDYSQLTQFVAGCGIGFNDAWLLSDTQSAYRAWDAYVQAKRSGQAVRRPIADILIGAFAEQRTGLITRNPQDFSKWFPNLRIVVP
jgi:hypothetical protein